MGVRRGLRSVATLLSGRVLSDVKVRLCRIRFDLSAKYFRLGCTEQHSRAELVKSRFRVSGFVKCNARPRYTYAVGQRSKVGSMITIYCAGSNASNRRRDQVDLPGLT